MDYSANLAEPGFVAGGSGLCGVFCVVELCRVLTRVGSAGVGCGWFGAVRRFAWFGAVRRTTSAALGSPRRDASPSRSRLLRGVPPRACFAAYAARADPPPRTPAPAPPSEPGHAGGRACRDSVGRDGDGAGRGDQVGLAVGSGPLVVAGRGAVVAPSPEGLGPVVSSAQGGEGVGPGLARVGRSPRTGVMWSRSQALASRLHHGNTQCWSRRMTSSRIQAGGSWASTASVRAMSRTGWMVTRDRPAQSLIRAIVAGPNLSTVPNPVPFPLSSEPSSPRRSVRVRWR